jgi:hypothetical protein
MTMHPTSLNERALAELSNYVLAARLETAAAEYRRAGKLYLADLLSEAARRLASNAEGRP